MKNFLLLIVFMFAAKAYSQNGCCVNIYTSHDTVVCGDSVQLHATFNSIAQLLCTTVGTPLNQNDYFATQFTINGSLSEGDLEGCGQGAKLIISVIDSVYLHAWSNNNVNYGQLNQFQNGVGNCQAHAENDFQFNLANPL